MGIDVEGGAGHHLEDVAIRGASRTGLCGRRTVFTFADGEIIDIAYGRGGSGILVEQGSLEMRASVLRRAGRRAILIRGSTARVIDLDVEG